MTGLAQFFPEQERSADKKRLTDAFDQDAIRRCNDNDIWRRPRTGTRGIYVADTATNTDTRKRRRSRISIRDDMKK